MRLHTLSGILDYVSGQYSVSTVDMPFGGQVIALFGHSDFLALSMEFTADGLPAFGLPLAERAVAYLAENDALLREEERGACRYGRDIRLSAEKQNTCKCRRNERLAHPFGKPRFGDEGDKAALFGLPRLRAFARNREGNGDISLRGKRARAEAVPHRNFRAAVPRRKSALSDCAQEPRGEVQRAQGARLPGNIRRKSGICKFIGEEAEEIAGRGRGRFHALGKGKEACARVQAHSLLPEGRTVRI